MAVLPDLDVVHAVLDVIPDAVLLVGTDGRIQFANGQVERVLGYPASRLSGRLVDDLLPESARPAHAAHRGRYGRHAVARPMGTGLPLLARHASGVDVAVDVSLGPLPIGTAPLVLVCIRDVSERARMVAALRSSEQRYRHVVEHATDVFYRLLMTDDPARGRLDYVSPQCERITGCPPAAFLRDPDRWISSIHEDDVDAVVSTTGDMLARGTGGARAYRIRNAVTGEYRWIDDRMAILQDDAGRTIGYQGTARDITEEVRARQEREALERQLQHARKMEAVGRLAAGVAHDFNNLLTVIGGCAEAALARTDVSDGLRDDLDTIAEVARRGASLTRQLLAFGRARVAAPRAFDPAAHLARLEGLLRRSMPAAMSLSVHDAGETWAVRIDPAQFDEIVLNLCVNARDAMPRGGRLSLSLMNATGASTARPGLAPGDYVQLVVADTGTGIDPAVLPHVFEPFFTTKGGDKGTGLGLASVFGIAKSNGGGVYVESAVGQGTTVTVFLPRHVGVIDAPPETAAPAPARGGGELVLVVDDDDDVRHVITRFLEGAGYTVLSVPDPDEALEVCRTAGHEISVLVTDLSMPGMNGYDLARRVAGNWPRVRILVTSGQGLQVTRDGLGLVHLPKPFDRETLARAVRTLLDGPA